MLVAIELDLVRLGLCSAETGRVSQTGRTEVAGEADDVHRTVV